MKKNLSWVSLSVCALLGTTGCKDLVELVHVNSKRGKNAADIRIVIDALELFYDEKNAFTHVLLVSGDGDFTELVHRLRAHGKTVIGMGISGTSADYLVNACDKFVFYDKWQGVSKFKKTYPNNGGQNQQAAKQISTPARSTAASSTPKRPAASSTVCTATRSHPSSGRR